MAYQALARKWRPQTFEDLVGQELLARTLQNALKNNRLHHAYLFYGTRGVGKTTTARILAKAVNCPHLTEFASPCNVCESCKEITSGKNVDVLEIDAASNTGVDDVKDVITRNIGMAPARDKYRVFIIDEVHMLSGAAFNSLLKTLEEPPPRRLFILATTELHKLPKTITSRCQQFNFTSIQTPKIAAKLKQIAEQEKVKISIEALAAIARAGEGSMRDAQSAFDQIISFVGMEITLQDVETNLGFVGGDVLARVMRAIADNKPAEGFAIVEEVVNRGLDLRVFCRDVLGYLRDLTVAKSGDISLIESSVPEAILKEQVALFSHQDLVRFFNTFAELEPALRTSPNPRYLVEIGLIKLIEMRRLVPIEQVINKINKLIPPD